VGPETAQAGTIIPGLEPVSQWCCIHGNHFCVACEECGRAVSQNGRIEPEDVASLPAGIF